ncbi:MAG: heavy metal-binding domain-containing protein [Acidimicrobiales bacterium]
MAEWNGVGLPPAAQRRVEVAGQTDLRSSLLSVSSNTGMESVGFTPVSEVMGCIVLSTSGALMPSCGVYQQMGMTPFGLGMNAAPARAYLADTQGVTTSGGYEPYVDVLNRGWAMAIDRMVQEATALGASGIVDVRLSEQRFEGGALEFMVLGTAVRSTVIDHLHDGLLFTTHVSGADFAKLVHHGWTPARLVVEVSLAIRHDDYLMLSQRSMFAQNVELPGLSELVSVARHGAKRRIERYLGRNHEVGAIIDSLRTRVFGNEPFENHSDHLAEVRVVGSTLRATGPQEFPMRTLSMISLKDPKR